MTLGGREAQTGRPVRERTKVQRRRQVQGRTQVQVTVADATGPDQSRTDRHAVEDYVILGERPKSVSSDALLSPNGRTSAAGRSRANGRRGAAAAVPFRFSRLGPKGGQLGARNREAVAEAMTAGGGGASRLPAGFTYLGQFIDHDLTSDVTKVMLGEDVSPAEMLQARSPTLDLDSLYGAGPNDPESEKFYRDGAHLKMGRTDAIDPDPAFDGFDLPRVGKGSSDKAKRQALIPDKRNDENLAVAQTHLAFIRFHNRVVDTLPASTPDALRFSRAKKQVVRHYQWMIRHDFLPRICRKSVLNDVFTNGRKVFEPDADPTSTPTMPVEFSIAAYRLGHSMVRRAYDWNRRFPDGQGTLDLLFQFSGTGGDLAGGLRLPSNWIADFRRLYDFTEAGRDDLAVPAADFNRAMRIDTLLVDPLSTLPSGTFGGGAGIPNGDLRRNLAFRNLTRAAMVDLSTGQNMVTFLRKRGVQVTALTKAQIRDGNGGATLDDLTAAQRAVVLEKTPLWFYVLREAEFNGGRLDGVGARIVAETFHRAIEGSRISILRPGDWRPSLGPDEQTFRMVDLMLFAFEGKKKLLNPLGG